MIDENSVITAILAILTEIKVEGEELFKASYDYIPNQFTAYPAVYVVPINWQEDYLDLRDTGIVAQFRIGIVYTLEPDIEQGQKQVRTAAKLVRNELKNQNNIQLGGTVDWSQLTTGSFSYDTREQKLAICEIELSVRKRYSRYETN